MSFSAWKTTGYLFYLLLGIWITVRVLFRKQWLRKISKPVFTVLIAGTVISFWASVSIGNDRRSADTGIIMTDEVHVRASPDEEGTELFSLHEGTKIWIRRQSEDWVEVRIADGKTGWLPRESFTVI
jgi:hypothetical protein